MPKDLSDLELIAEAIVDGLDWTDKLISETDLAYENLFATGGMKDSSQRWLEGDGACRFEQHERRAVLMQMVIVHREKLLDGGMDSTSVNVMMRAIIAMLLAGELAREELFQLRLEAMNRGEDSVVTMN